MVQIGTSIPKATTFRFKNHWIDQPGFLDLVHHTWNTEVRAPNAAAKISAKFKLLTRVLKHWAKGLSNMKRAIKQCNDVMLILDNMEENIPLFTQEKNFRSIMKKHLTKLLQQQKNYWRQRYTVRWTMLEDESTKFFHAAATDLEGIGLTPSTAHTHIWEEFR
jgi:hypothetical protein